MAEIPKIPRRLNTSEDDIIKKLYEPCLVWAKSYDRGVGYFTSGWLKENSKGMGEFAENNGKARWIASPIIEKKDLVAIKNGEALTEEQLVEMLNLNINTIEKELEENTRNALAWLIYDGVIEFKFAVPKNKLEDGDFHDKFGIFYDEFGNKIAFSGSMNDSVKGFRNYESIKTFTTGHPILDEYVEDEVTRFNKLWENEDINIDVYDIPSAIKEKIFKLRKFDRPYKLKKHTLTDSRWQHQKEAEEIFVKMRYGILAMATGTGKTRTALNIANRLLNENNIHKIIVTVSGTDLLDQWCNEIRENSNLKVYRYYDSYKELSNFLFDSGNSALVVARSNFLVESLKFIKLNIKSKSLIICDEVHGLGSNQFVEKLGGEIKSFKYRLGLSATPEREYDELGNYFIEEEIGKIIFTFSIEDAIKKGILCEFDYTPLSFSLTENDKQQVKGLIASFNAKKKAKESVNIEELYRNIARVKKVSEGKIPIFVNYLENNPKILERCLIFVETKEFGLQIQNIIINHIQNFHTYFGEDDRRNLIRFSNNELDCLITSKRISEGIDISSVENIILFSADKSKIQTIQRIGRALRLDMNNANKKALILDFIENSEESDKDDSKKTDAQRKEWLTKISQTKKEG